MAGGGLLVNVCAGNGPQLKAPSVVSCSSGTFQAVLVPVRKGLPLAASSWHTLHRFKQLPAVALPVCCL